MTENQSTTANSRFSEISSLVRSYMDRQNATAPFVSGKTRIPLSAPTYGSDEVIEALESMMSTWVTMGKKVGAFEKMFADYLGSTYSMMVNSGSSANLLALSALTSPAFSNPIKAGDEIITPSVTWATTVFPIANVGATPVLVDVGLESFNIDPEAVERAITPKTRAILLVHLLGNPCDMDALKDIASRHNLYLMEDSCEAHGAEYKGQKVGSFGDVSTFSFFFSHHISTIEGGMIVTDNHELSELIRSLRVFGWVREMENRDELAKKYEEIDHRFLFVNNGYNLRPTEIQGAFGMHQMPRLEPFIQGRRDNAVYWTNQLEEFSDFLILPKETPGTRNVWFGYPITVRPGSQFSRKDIVSFLESRGLETRPIMAGNIAEQPAMGYVPHRVAGPLDNARKIQRQSFFFGNHQGIGEEEREAVVNYFKDFFAEVN